MTPPPSALAQRRFDRLIKACRDDHAEIYRLHFDRYLARGWPEGLAALGAHSEVYIYQRSATASLLNPPAPES